MEKTNYIGKIIDNHIFLICKNENGNTVQCPHAELFMQNNFVALPIPEDSEPKAPYKRLTKKEVALFFNGMDTNGNILEKPSENLAKSHQRHLELLATNKEYRETWEEFQKQRAI